MQIGSGKQGVIVGEYGCERPQKVKKKQKPESELSVKSEDGNDILGWIEPACDEPQWILWFTRKGDAFLYTGREASGATVGEPIKVKARGRKS